MKDLTLRKIKTDGLIGWTKWLQHLERELSEEAKAQMIRQHCLSETWFILQINNDYYTACFSNFFLTPQPSDKDNELIKKHLNKCKKYLDDQIIRSSIICDL